LELNPIYKSSHILRKDSNFELGEPLRDISNERKVERSRINEQSSITTRPMSRERERPKRDIQDNRHERDNARYDQENARYEMDNQDSRYELQNEDRVRSRGRSRDVSDEPREKKYEYSYQRYQDKNYDFINNKIGDNPSSNKNYSSQKLRSVKFNDFENVKGKTFDQFETMQNQTSKFMGEDRQPSFEQVSHHSNVRLSHDGGNLPRKGSYERMSHSNFGGSRERMDRSKSFERRANESAHSHAMRQMEAGPSDIRYTGASLSMSDNKGGVRSDYPKSTSHPSQEYIRRDPHT
jgi:hypothetical protein